MTYTASNSIDFRAVAKELVGTQQRVVVAPRAVTKRSNGTELTPAEVGARIARDGSAALRRPNLLGATVDQEGLTNNYPVMPSVYFSAFPSPDQARRYAFQGALATLFVTSLILTAIAVS